MDTLLGMLNQDAEHNEEEQTRRAQLLRVAAHDLRGPLANIKSYVSLLRATKTPLEPRVQRSLDVIARNAERAIALVDDGLDAARHESGALSFERTEQPSRELILDALARCRRQAEPFQVEILGEVAESLPPVRVDGPRMRRAIEALVLHLVLRSQPGQRVNLDVNAVSRGVLIRAYSSDGVEPALDCFAGTERVLGERAFEDPIRLWLAAITADAHEATLRLVEGEPGGFELLLPS